MHKPFVALLLICLFLKARSIRCPGGSQPIPNQDLCLLAVNEPEFYNDAARRCTALGGTLVQIQNSYENAYVYVMTSGFIGVDPYIGVERNARNIWTYSDGTPLTYQNWAPNEPRASNTSICATMDLSTGRWQAADCTYGRPFFCSFAGNNDPQCPADWVYNDYTDNCYYLQNFTYPDGINQQKYTVTEAENACQQMRAHLVSIHSKEEDDFIYGLIALKGWSLRTQSWIGYYGNGTIGTGQWIDGSVVDYVGDHYPTSSIGYWQICSGGVDGCQRWDGPLSGSNPWPRFVCKMPSGAQLPKKIKRKKVKE